MYNRCHFLTFRRIMLVCKQISWIFMCWKYRSNWLKTYISNLVRTTRFWNNFSFDFSRMPFQDFFQIARTAHFFFFFPFSLQSRSTLFFPPPILSWPWNSSTNLYESGICTLELYTKIFVEPARANNVAIKLRKINSIMSCYYLTTWLFAYYCH